MTVSGWFADPGGKVNTFRWWDGEAWTRWLSADPSAPDPGAEPTLPEPEAAPAVADSVPADPLDLAALPPPDPADRVVRLPAAAAIVVGVVLLTVIVVVGATNCISSNDARHLPGLRVAGAGRPAAPDAGPHQPTATGSRRSPWATSRTGCRKTAIWRTSRARRSPRY